jgi:hypothetical protein
MNEENGRMSTTKKEGSKYYGRLRKELKRATDNAEKEHLERLCDQITEFQRTGRYDLMYMKTKELSGQENLGIQSIGIEDSQGNIKIDQRKILQILENNRPEHLEVEPKRKNMKTRKALIFGKVKWKRLPRRLGIRKLHEKMIYLGMHSDYVEKIVSNY